MKNRPLGIASLDGVYTGFEHGQPLTFHNASHLTDAEVDWMVRHIQSLIFGHLRRRGYLDDEAALVDGTADELDELGTYHAAAVQGLIPYGSRSGQPATLFGDPVSDPLPRPQKKLCADHGGYSLHAAIRIGAGNASRLEKLCRYITRPPFSQDRLSIVKDGSIVYRFRRPWRNGKRAVVMDPLTFLSRLAAQIPPPRFYMLSYYGVLAPAASSREEIVPGHREAEESCQGHHVASSAEKRSSKDPLGHAKKKRLRPERMLWAELVRRVWLTDILRCPCGGTRRVLAMVFNPESIQRILTHMGLPHVAPSRAPPRPSQLHLPFEE